MQHREDELKQHKHLGADDKAEGTVKPRTGVVEGTDDTYDQLLEVAYAREEAEQESGADGEEEGDGAELFQATPTCSIVYPDRPTCISVLQVKCPARGWVTVYRGTKRQHLVQGLRPAEELLLRVRCHMSPGPPSRWSSVTITTSARPGSGVWQALTENRAPEGKTLLNELCTVRRLLVDCIQPNSFTPLTSLIRLGQREAVANLLEAGAAVGACSRGTVSPLKAAVWSHDSLASDSTLIRRLTDGTQQTDAQDNIALISAAKRALLSGSEDALEMVRKLTAGSSRQF